MMQWPQPRTQKPPGAPGQGGFTLIEMLIVISMVGILGAISYPLYTSQIAKGRRAECRSGLMQALQQQERYFTQFNSYATGANVANIRTFSGDNAASSVCINFTASACATPSATCVKMEGTMRLADPKITSLSVDSDGNKDCVLSAGTDKSLCWP
jgi:type IV pilus assembly protein PilE